MSGGGQRLYKITSEKSTSDGDAASPSEHERTGIELTSLTHNKDAAEERTLHTFTRDAAFLFHLIHQ